MEDKTLIEQNTMQLLEDKKGTTGNGREYWLARDLQVLLGYSQWREFTDVIERAKQSCATFGGNIGNHFVLTHKTIALPKGASREIEDFILSRYACYLIAMNGNPSKPEIAGAQAYFAYQTRKQELFDQLSETQKRLILRDRVKNANQNLSGAAKEAGVQNFPAFQDAGYRGLYGGLGVSEIKEIKKISAKEKLLDCMGRPELAANEFRITQTEQKLKHKQIKGDIEARKTHYEVGQEVRNTIQKIGGSMPEKLPREPSIKQLKRGIQNKQANELQQPNISE